jgi:hypothetical protein
MTTCNSLDLRLARLTAKAQDLLPEHTYKAVMRRVSRYESLKVKCEMLEVLLREFERGKT